MKPIKPLTTKGAALVEYAALVGLIGVVSATVVLQLGEEVDTTFNTVDTTLSDEVGAAVAAAGGTGTTQPTASPTAPAAPAAPGAARLPIGDCFALSAGAGQDASSFPAPDCFSFAAALNDAFTWDADERLIYITGMNQAFPPVEINGSADDTLLGLEPVNTGFDFVGGGGTNTIYAPNISSSEVYFDNAAPGVYFIDVFDGPDPLASSFSIFGTFEDVAFVELSDTTLSIADIDACIADTSCVFGLGGPPLGGGGPIGFSDYTQMDGCLIHDPTGDYIWCPNPNPPANADIDAPHSVANGGPVEFRPRNGELCAYDTTPGWDDFVYMAMGPFPPDPLDNSDLACG